MSKVLVVTELVPIVSEKVIETFDVIETEVSPSEGELDDTVGGVVSDEEEVTVNELTAKGALILLALSITVMVQLL